MPVPDEALISYVVSKNALEVIQRAGVGTDEFVDEHRSVWKYLCREKAEHGAVPSKTVLLSRFPDYELPRVQERDVPMLIAQLKQRRKHNDFLRILTDAAGSITDFDSVDAVMDQLRGDVNRLSLRNADDRQHLVPLFTHDTTEQMVQEMRWRADPEHKATFIKTGLQSFDQECGGLQKQKMVVIIGRPGLGKSWLDLMFVAQAVMQGKSVILYPLEMTLFETACRLYTLFTQSMFGPSKVLRNHDLNSGNVNYRRTMRMLHTLEDTLPGSLHVADVARLGDPYTSERVTAEVEMHRPDMFWVDYLTLMKPSGSRQVDEWGAVRELSNAIKTTAMRCDTVGGCSAQVNRAAMISGQHFLPRLEHIAYGDSIGQDADQVFSINRRDFRGTGASRKPYLFYALVKNRGGAEIKKRRVSWNPNEGLFFELAATDAANEESNTTEEPDE